MQCGVLVVINNIDVNAMAKDQFNDLWIDFCVDCVTTGGKV